MPLWAAARRRRPRSILRRVSFDDDADEDAPRFKQPPHPEDRLWRHPSEVGSHPVSPIDALVQRPAGSGGWRAVAAAGALGVVIVVAVVAVILVGNTGGSGGGNEDDDTASPSTASGSDAPGSRSESDSGPASESGSGSESAPSSGAGGAAGSGAESGGAEDAAAAEVAEQVATAVVGLDGGSGVVVQPDGVVLTSAALIDGDGPVDVRLADGSVVEAQVVGVDMVTGLGVLDLPGDDHAAAEVGVADDAVGGPAFTVRATQDSDDAAASPGVVGSSHKLRADGDEGLDGVVEVAGTTDPLALGGPVVDRDGAVIGITTALDGERSSYLTPIDVGEKVATDLLDSGRVHHAWLGIEGQDHIEGSGIHSASGYGAEVAAVAPDSAAEAAGLRPGDVIVSIDGQRVERMPDLVRRLRSLSPGDETEITIERDGEETTVTATLAERTTD
jgi:S1-C subfamily serine protease